MRRGGWKVMGIAVAWPVLCLALAQAPPAGKTAPAMPTADDEKAAVANADPAQGRILYDRYCKLCHGEGGKGYAADNANALASPEFLASAGDALLLTAIDRGRPGTPMAAFGWRFGGPLEIGDLFHVWAYLRSLETRPRVDVDKTVVRGNPAAGAAVFARECAQCHGPEGKSKTAPGIANPLLLATASDGYIRYAIEHGRSGTPMAAFGGKLSAREIDDVTRFVRSLARTVKDERPSGAVPRAISDLVIHPEGPAPAFPPLREGRYLSVDDAKKAYEAGARMVILDARPTSDWLMAHIPGALPVPYYGGQEKIVDSLPRDGTWILTYCACPHAASDHVTDMLRSKGFEKTAVLDEGFFVWAERGYPVTFGSNTP